MKLFDRARRQEPMPEPSEDNAPLSMRERVNQAFTGAESDAELTPEELNRKSFVEERLRGVFGKALQEVELDTNIPEGPEVDEIRENLADLEAGSISEASKPSDL